MMPADALRRLLATAMLAALALAAARAQVGSERLERATAEPHNWLTYSGNYNSDRHSRLDQITPANVADLEQQWVYQSSAFGLSWTPTPLVADGIMYITQRPNDIVALDARTGRVFWIYSYPTPPDVKSCCGYNNRGVALLGERLFMATLDAHVVAVDAATGAELWDVELADNRLQYSFTLAPLAVGDLVLVGTSGGDRGIRGFISALDAATGEEVWRFHTIPAPGEPGHETWEPCPPDPETYCDPEAWKHGGGAVWITGSYDPELNLTYWGVGNPGPDWNPSQRPGDNRYTSSVVALDADTGELRWHFQFTPGDPYDYDAVQIPVLADVQRGGTTLKAMLWANRNGFYYVLDRETGRFLTGRAFVKVNWAEGLDDSGRPIATPQAPGDPTFPSLTGATNWYSPSYSPRTELFYVSAWEDRASIFNPLPQVHEPGEPFHGGFPQNVQPVPGAPTVPTRGPGPINNWTTAAGYGAVLALDALTGEERWRFELTDVIRSGLLTTASDLLFSGARSGYFQAHDARNGELLWKINLGGQIESGPITYAVDGRQYVTMVAGQSLSAFALPD